MGITHPSYKAAVVQAAPVWIDLDTTFWIERRGAFMPSRIGDVCTVITPETCRRTSANHCATARALPRPE